MTPRKMEIYRRTGTPIPVSVSSDYTTDMIINIFQLAWRSKKAVDGFLLPLTVSDITQVAQAVSPPVDMHVLIQCVFDLDDIETRKHNNGVKKNVKQ